MALATLLAFTMVGCDGSKNNSKSDTNKVKESKEKITYVSKGNPVTDNKIFGDNVYVFDSKDKIEDVQNKIDSVYKKQESNQFGDERYALLFKSGKYDKSLSVKVGFYTQVSGLGIEPTDTNINQLWVDAKWMGTNATCNFWRSAENFSINKYCMWANSQAVSLRRVNSSDGIVLSDGEGWSSGGFIADSKFAGTVSSGSQQQYLCRNNQWNNWENGVTGTFYSLNTFYIANPDKDNSKTLNKALADGKNILFTPGIYNIEETLKVTKKDTIIYGMGLATLEASKGNVVMNVSDEDGIKVCGLLFDAGEKESTTLLQVGDKKTKVSHANNPLSFSDVYFRVGGGKYAGKVKNCVTINSNNVIGDNFWVWRADHSTNVGWDVNTATNGIIVNGDNVTMYGLFVEHFKEYQTIWNGENGKLFFYQSELPYDVPKQKAYKSHNGKVNGYASIKVADSVKKFESYGIGVYCYNRDSDIDIASAVEVPDRKGVKLHNTCTVKLNGQGQISHIINKSGTATENLGNACRIREYENGIVIQ